MSSTKRRREQAKAPVNTLPKRTKKISDDTSSNQPIEAKLNFKNPNWDPQRKTRGQVWPKLKKIYQIENYDQYHPSCATHASVEAPPSALPAKKYCDITGYDAPYTHPTTGIRYANVEVYRWIIQNLTTFETQQEYLSLRGAETRIK